MTPAAAFARLPAPADDWEGRHSLGLRPEGAATLADLAGGGSVLERLVALKQAQTLGGDVRMGCAYLIGDLGWEVGGFLGSLWLAGWQVADVDPAAVAITSRALAWERDGEAGVAQVLDLTFDPAGLAAGGSGPADLARVIEGLHAGAIAALARQTGLGAVAQWRLVSDGVAGALVHQGRAMGCVDRAVDLARAVVGEAATRLQSRKVEIVQVHHPRRPDIADWFRLRGGCCRYYTASGEAGVYCTTCVHRNRDDQIARLADYLDRSHAEPSQAGAPTS